MLLTSSGTGFVSIDCGGTEIYTDEIGLKWNPDNFTYGETANISVAGESRKQYQTLRHFPRDGKKYCHTLNVKSGIRYLVRATFLYGHFDSSRVFPKFDISIGPTHWSTVDIFDANTTEILEAILLANSDSISVCLSNASTGVPFISTLELRQFNYTMYSTDYEDQYFLSVSARINFGTDDTTPVRYPDDPFDRIWTSDSLRQSNFLVDVAPGTYKMSTKRTVDVNKDERPPEKVMQSAVVGRNGNLSYQLNLEGFSGFSWAVYYFAELEDLGPNETRKFKLSIPDMPILSERTINIQENVGKFSFNLSGKNLTGNVSPELSTLTGLTELWLNNNFFTGPIPDLSGCINLTIM
ncbi:putative LRR receptor-like serine/threonine-protein kinase [Nymphaea thermarum]|nr:putative LRR receptor-like serine/threonine-protein kinase [Nymphaea thermarum]